MPAESSTPSHSPLFCFCLPVHVRDWCGTPTVPKRTPSCHDSCPIQAEQSLYNVYKNRFLPDLRLVLPPFHFLSAPFPSSFRSSFSCSSFFFFYSLCLCPLHFTMFLFLLLFRASWTFAVSTFFEDLQDLQQSQKRFSCTIHTIHSINSTSSLSKIEKAEQSRAPSCRIQDTCLILERTGYVPACIFVLCCCGFFTLHLFPCSSSVSSLLFCPSFFLPLCFMFFLFPVLLYFLVASLPFLGQGERAMARRQNGYSRVWCRLRLYTLYIYIRVQIRGEELCR